MLRRSHSAARSVLSGGPGALATSGSRCLASSTLNGGLTREQILALPSMPAISPSYPMGPYRFVNREYFIVSYETDMDSLRRVIPEPLEPISNQVLYEWIAMPDSSGFGSYQESGTVVPCLYEGKPVNYTVQMFLNDEPPIACGREIWGFPKKYAEAELRVEKDTLTGILTYGGRRAAMGTMAYKYNRLDKTTATNSLSKLNCNLKIIPGHDFKPQIAQLVAYNLQDIEVMEAWEGPARLHLIPHVNAPAADLPVRKIMGGKHIRANLTLPHGFVLHDYISERKKSESNFYMSGNPLAEKAKATEKAKAKAEVAPQDDEARLTREKILNLPSMPAICPSYPAAPSHMSNREYMIISYKTDPEAVRRWVPELLQPDDNIHLSWVKTESSGYGVYQKMTASVGCKYNGEDCTFPLMAIVNCSSAITAGREVHGQPQKFGFPSLTVDKDTLYGETKYGQQEVATGSMVYKHHRLDLSQAYKFFEKPEINLKVIPSVTGAAEIAQLISLLPKDVKIKDAWRGPARLNIIPHVNAPLADLPVVEGTCEGHYIVVEDMVLPEGTLIHDYTLDADKQSEAAQAATHPAGDASDSVPKEERFRRRMERFLEMPTIVQ